MKHIVLSSLTLLLACTLTSFGKVLMTSPDGKVGATLSLNPNGSLHYSIEFKGITVVEPSTLGITIDGTDLGSDATIGEATTSVISESYPTRGVKTEAHNHYHLWKIPLTHQPSGKNYSIQFRLYDDGVAYRYIVPGTGILHVDGESSSWKIMPRAKTWYFERLAKGWKLKSYAGEWLSTDIEQLETATPAKIGPVQGTPLVFELPSKLGYALVTKAALYNYSGMRLKAVGHRTVVADFTEGKAGFDVEGTVTTPWRATLLADDLDELVNSDFIKNLNPAPDPGLFADTSYIKPGRSFWRWHTLRTGSPAQEQEFIDHSARAGFEFYLIDDGWNDVNHPFQTLKRAESFLPGWEKPFEALAKLTHHAKSKNIGVWVWAHSKFLRDPANDYKAMGEFFDQVKEAGAVGIKIDFMNGESKDLIDFEIAALRMAAERKLMINYHGCHASTGEERTYPNEMTREGIRGLELNNMKEGSLTASHNAALPFTRFVVGHGDYTPLGLMTPGPTTWAHQLATTIAFTSPMQCYTDHPDFLFDDPRANKAIDVLKAIPAAWDETKVLPGSAIGDLCVMARRSGATWFVGILNGGTARDYSLDLSFLPAGEFNATLVSDDPKAEPVNLVGLNRNAVHDKATTSIPYAVDHKIVNNSAQLKVFMADGGGFVVQLTKR